MSAPNDPTYDAAAAEAAAAAAIADAEAAAAAAGSGAPHPPVPPSPIVPTAASQNNHHAKEAAQAEAPEVPADGAASPVPQILPAVSPTAPRYADADLHRHDVLSGRGGFVNAHPGNHHLRTLCQYRKKEWDDGNNATKRRIAIEIYGMIRRLNPPGRFLKKEILPGGGGAPGGAGAVGGKGSGGGGGGGSHKQASKGAAEEAETSATATAAAVAAEVLVGAAATDSAEASAAAAAAIAAGDSETASAIMAPNVLAVQQAKAQQANAPWVELNEEKSIQKAMQVMRDYKRPDRQERDNKPGKRKRSNLPRGGGLVDGTGAGADGVGGVGGTPNSQADGYDEQMREQHVEAAALADAYEAKGSGNAADDAAAAAAAAGNEVLPQADANVYAEGCTNGIIPTNVDVLTGRGAFINDHPGNKYWRTLAKQGKARFDAGDQTDKKEVAMEIVRAVTNQAPTGGRFLRKIDPIPATGKKGKAARAFALTPRGFQGPWEVMDETEARVKTIQTLRDMGRDKSKNKKRRTSAPPSASKAAPAAGASAAMPEMPPVGAGAAQEPDYTKPLAEDVAQQQQMVTNPVMVGDDHAAV